MSRMFLRLSITRQAIAFLLLVSALTCGVLYLWAVDNGINSEIEHAKTVADLTESFRTLSTRNGGIYIRRDASADVATVGRYLAEFTSHQQQADGSEKQFVFHQKNPFLALGDLSSVVAQSPAQAKFRMVSDNQMNPANAPDLFELRALAEMRQDSKTEAWAVVGPTMRYARALVADKSCLMCHGKPEDAPPTVRAQYRAPMGSTVGGGYGYTEGAVVGITSVTIPHRTPLEMIAHQGLFFWGAVTSLSGVLALGFFGVVAGLVKPLNRLNDYADEVANRFDLENVAAPSFDKQESTSANEIHTQSHKLQSLHESMRSAMKVINDHAKR